MKSGLANYWRVHYTCGCGQKGLTALVRMDGELDRNSLHCDQCARLECKRLRTERKRLATRLKRGSDEPYEPRPCSHCGQPFTPERSTARYCSTRCRVAFHRAKLAGQTSRPGR
jgi:hypothetical protein